MCERPSPIQGRVLHTLTTGREEDVLYILLSYVGEDVMGIDVPPVKVSPMPNLNTGGPIVVPTTNGASLSDWGWLRGKYALAQGVSCGGN
jgi:hypothetical protein